MPNITKKKYFKYLILSILIIFHSYIGVRKAWQMQSDFPNYYVASKLLLEGKNTDKIYDNAWFQTQISNYHFQQQGKFSPFPLNSAFVLLPFAGFEPLLAKRIWLIINLFFVVFCIILIDKILNISYLDSSLFILLSGFSLTNNLILGQMYVLVLLIILLCLYLAQNQRNSYAGGILSVGIALKYFPVLLMMSYFFTKNYRLFISALLGLLFIISLEISVFGIHTYLQYINHSLFPHLQGNLSGQSIYAYAFQSWNSLLMNIFVYHPLENPQPIIAYPSAFYGFKYGIMFLIVGLAGFSLYKIYLIQSKQAHLYYFSILTFTAAVLSPASASYHQLLLLFPLIFLYQNISPTNFYKQLIFWVLYLGLYFFPIDFFWKIPRVNGFELIFYYPRLWILLAIFLFASYIFQKIESKS